MNTLVITDYFDKYRPLAFAIATCGIPVGNMVYPWLSRSLMMTYGWRGSLLITSAITLNICVPATLMRPTVQNMKHNSGKFTKPNNDSHLNEMGRNMAHVLYIKMKLVFSEWSYVLFCIVYFLHHFIVSVAMIHVVAFVESTGVSQNWSSLIVTSIALANLGRSAPLKK